MKYLHTLRLAGGSGIIIVHKLYTFFLQKVTLLTFETTLNIFKCVFWVTQSIFLAVVEVFAPVPNGSFGNLFWEPLLCDPSFYVYKK